MNKFNSNIQIFWGPGGIKKAYELTLQAKNLDIVCLSAEYQKIIGVYFDKEYAPRLFGSATMTREILPDNTENREDSKKKNGRKNRVKFLESKEKSESDYMLFEDRAILVSYNSQIPFAVVLEDRDLVLNLRTQFEGLWKNL